MRKTTHYGLRIAAIGAGLLLISSIYFFYRGQHIFENLLEHGQNTHTTHVFSRWWTLTPDSGLTQTAVTDLLGALAYQRVEGDPSKPGSYQQSAKDVVKLFLRPFHYPDVDMPAQLVTLTFDRQQRLERVDAPAPPAEGWRLEPKLLAQWSSDEALTRRQIRLEELPPYVPQAIVAIEDKRFYSHGAFDVVGVLRALTVDLRSGHLSQGASTISQQLARSIFLTPRRTVSRKLLEAVLAAYLELRLPKRQLLEMYLNQVYWGQDGAQSLVGIDAVSETYFGKAPQSLTLGEAALLAGLLQSPNHYSPRSAPHVALERRNLVLKLMHEQGFITESAYRHTLREPLRVLPAVHHANEAAYFLTSLQDGLEDRYPGTTLPTAGWTIYTTLDPLLEHVAVGSIQRLAHGRTHPEGALIALDPRTGAVRAWVGGTDYALAPYDRAIHAHRQPGSAFKPFVMLAAIDKRVATLATVLKDEPMTLKTAQGTWSPQNYDRQYRHQTTVWDSLVHSLNVPTVNLALQTGVPTVTDYAHRVGIQSALSPFPAMALGSSEVTLLELSNAYATLADSGTYQPAYTVDWILDADQHVIEAHAATPVQAVDPLSAALVTQMLQAVLIEGTGAASHAMGLTIPAAGKTGTSEHFQDAWFVGYTPDLVCGVWVGYDQPKSLGRTAAGVALPLWVPFMEKAQAFYGSDDFVSPAGLVEKTVDPDTGYLARSGCPRRRTLSFLPGTEPTQDCPVHAGGIVGFFHRLLGPKPPVLPPVKH